MCDPHWEFRALANLVRQINVSLLWIYDGLDSVFPTFIMEAFKPPKGYSVILTTTSAKLCHLDENSYFIAQLVQTSDDDHPSDLPLLVTHKPLYIQHQFFLGF